VAAGAAANIMFIMTDQHIADDLGGWRVANS
jgi:hypothetical protein